MSVHSIEAEVSIKSGVQAECTIGREVIVEVHDEVNLESLKVTANGSYEPEAGVDGFSSVDVDVKYQNLIDYINEVTGGEDTSLSDAVESLVAGHGQGGGTDYLPMFLNDTLTEYSSDEITELPTSTFQSKSIQRITLPNITRLQNYTFRYSKLTGIYANDFPKLATNGGWGFQGCTDLVFAVLKACNNIQISSFSGCTSLTVLDVGNPTLDGYSLQQNSLNGASALNKIILRFKTVMSIQALSAFTGTPFSSDGTGGTIYVPQYLISAYRENSAWSTVLGYNANNQILSIEGSIYETQYADGTPIA